MLFRSAPLAAIVVMDATGSPALENERMMYRLNYADPLQARTYANSRWSACFMSCRRFGPTSRA